MMFYLRRYLLAYKHIYSYPESNLGSKFIQYNNMIFNKARGRKLSNLLNCPLSVGKESTAFKLGL